MYCKNCGNLIDDKASKCQYCGYIYSSQKATYNYNANVYKKDSNVLAIVGFVMAFFMPIVGLICSIMGYKSADEYRDDYKSLALAGIIISAIETVGLVLGIGIWILAVIFPLMFLI